MKFTRTVTLNYTVNMIGLASSILLFYIALSNNAWWMVRGGTGDEYTFIAEVSPFNIVVKVLDRPVTVPILPYLCLAARLSILLAATTTFIGSLLASKPWSKPMMSISGLKLPIIFIGILFASLSLANLFIDVNIPITGESTLKYVIPYHGSTIATETPVITTLTEEYWIALAAGVLSALAKIAHNKALLQRNNT